MFHVKQKIGSADLVFHVKHLCITMKCIRVPASPAILQTGSEDPGCCCTVSGLVAGSL